jgi:gluconate 2-dehydrogenase gamma chain
MTKHDAGRRAFLVRTVASAGTVVGAGLVPDALAENHDHQPPSAPAPARHHGASAEAGAFFNQDQAATIAAFAERLMPGAPGKPGASEAGVLNYIDLALAGVYSDLQDFYRRGLAQLDAYCRASHGRAFAQLNAAEQDQVVAALDEGKASGFAWPTAQEFFNTVRTHTLEGMFADPIYGGNRDFSGWQLVGFPGAQGLFTPTDLESRRAFTRKPIAGIQTEDEERRA